MPLTMPLRKAVAEQRLGAQQVIEATDEDGPVHLGATYRVYEVYEGLEYTRYEWPAPVIRTNGSRDRGVDHHPGPIARYAASSRRAERCGGRELARRPGWSGLWGGSQSAVGVFW